MAKFIELHRYDKGRDGKLVPFPVLVNLYNIQKVVLEGTACDVYTFDERIRTIEGYEQVRSLIGAACGGIPIPRLDDKIESMD